MSTIIDLPPNETQTRVPCGNVLHPFVTFLCGQEFICIQDDCDGLHHFMCSCATADAS